MATGDFLKAALEKKKQATQAPGKKNSKIAGKTMQGNQVTTNKPQKKAIGRGG
jgi:hypothetical protein